MKKRNLVLGLIALLVIIAGTWGHTRGRFRPGDRVGGRDWARRASGHPDRGHRVPLDAAAFLGALALSPR